ncbi:antitoxin protein of toxin-antitoxin system [Brevibacterium sanguinis]|uniref:Antitoxin protein of toxin-antitoxin system n=2 Tax=Brevibacterium TaxID=1696 RepID=A0A366IIP1_9MICO|nr:MULTISPECIES: antitoxin [Brevibacterium]RBP63676.1 antitoxin protein of toxin-antitoxin system [Brevibacterium sanguinis]RBP70335.1 antitoxin protein of toxin-antitoxin system [Brevibacterium celere]
MGFDDLINQAKDALSSDQAEQISDQGLDRAADFGNDLSGGRFGDQIDQGREAADGHVGTE